MPSPDELNNAFRVESGLESRDEFQLYQGKGNAATWYPISSRNNPFEAFRDQKQNRRVLADGCFISAHNPILTDSEAVATVLGNVTQLDRSQ